MVSSQSRTSHPAGEKALSSRVYRAWDDFDVLNESRDAYGLADYRPGQTHLLWANKELLATWGLTMEQWRGIDCNQGNSDAILDFNRRIFENVQKKQEVYECPKTFHTKKGAIHGLFHVRPVRVILPGEKQERVLSLFAHYTTDEGSEHNSWRHSTELMFHLDVACMMFERKEDFLSAKAQYANLKAQDFYLESKASSERGRKPSQECSDLTLKNVMESCIFDSAQERTEVLNGVRNLKLGCKRIEVICRKKRTKQGAKVDVDGSHSVWHRVAFIPALDPATSTPCILINEFDVSVLKRVKDDLSSVSQAQADLKDFLSVVAHELRTPLNGIIGLSQTIMRDEECSDRVRRSAEWIKHSGERLTTLVVDVVDAARLQGKQRIEMKDEVKLTEVIQSVWEGLTQKRAVNPGVDLVNRVPADLGSVQGNRVRITQVCTNLLSNAVKFTLKGQVAVSARMEVVDGRDHVRVEVQDTGVGIPQDKLEDIWKAFQQGDMSASRKFEGAGLGLSLVKDMVRAHGGTVGVVSRHGGADSGSNFHFSIPVTQPDFVAPRVSPTEVPRRPQRSSSNSHDTPPCRTASQPSSEHSGPTVSLSSLDPRPPSSDPRPPPPQPPSAPALSLLQAFGATSSAPGPSRRDAACNTDALEPPAAARGSAIPASEGGEDRTGGGISPDGSEGWRAEGGGRSPRRERNVRGEESLRVGSRQGRPSGMEDTIIRHLLRERTILREEMTERQVLHQSELQQHHRITTSLFQDLCPGFSPAFGAPQARSSSASNLDVGLHPRQNLFPWQGTRL